MAAIQDGRRVCQQAQPGTTQAQRVPSSLSPPQVICILPRHHLKVALNGREANIIIQDK